MSHDLPQSPFPEDWLVQADREKLCASDGVTVFRLAAKSPGEDYILATSDWGSAEGCRRVENDFALSSRLPAGAARAPVAYFRGNEGPNLLFADKGQKLASFSKAPNPDVEAFLDIAVAASLSLSRIHASGVLHNRITPDCLIRDESGNVLFANFWFGTASDQKDAPLAAPTLLEMPYMAPEQARNINPVTDERGDLYSLGAVLYELLVGSPPLSAETAAQWLHAHIAIEPIPADQQRGDVPEMLSRVLAKLLAKNADDRYQTAAALHADLVRLRDEWRGTGAMKVFPLARADRHSAGIGRTALFGRDRETKRLQQLLNDVTQSQSGRLLFMSGPAGSGKSALIGNLSEGPTLGAGLFASGKCDQSQKNIPYAPFVQILRTLTQRVLEKSQTELDHFRTALSAALGGHGALIADLVPEIELIIGPPSPLLDLQAQAARARFHAAMTNTLGAFAMPGEPVVIAVDDLQWADEPSLAFFESFSGELPASILLLAAFRLEERASLEPVLKRVEDQRVSADKLDELVVGPLSFPSTTELIRATFQANEEDAKGLAPLIYEKTAGNPFFVNQQIRTLIDDDLIRFDNVAQKWTWNLAEIGRHHLSENVVDLIVRRLDGLPAPTRDLLKYMACIGHRSDQSLVLQIAGIEAIDFQETVASAVDAGLLVIDSSAYIFAHDRVLEAAYGLTTEADRPHVHARIANLMITLWKDRLHEAAFEIASQIDRADKDSLSQKERLSFVRALVAAARRAKAASAIRQATSYLATGADLLGENGWEEDYDLCFELSLLRSECFLINTEFDQSSASLADLLAHARTALESAHVYRLMAILQTVRSDYEGAIIAALSGLKLLGQDLPRLPDMATIDGAYQTVKTVLGRRSIEDIQFLPLATEPEIDAATGLLSTLAATFFVNDGLSFLHLAKSVELTLRHGLTPASAYGLAWFGVYIAHQYGAYEDGFKYAEVALKVVEKHGYEAARPGTLVAMDQVSPWTKSLSYALARAREGAASGYAGGDLGMACYACNHIVSDLLVMGEHLALIGEDIERGLKLTRQIGYIDVEQILAAQARHACHLREGGYVPRSTDSEETWISRSRDSTGRAVSQPTIFWDSLYAGITAVVFHDYAGALRLFEGAAPLAWSIPAHVNLSDFHLYSALAVAHTEAGQTGSEDILEKLAGHRRKMTDWAAINPSTFRSKLLLIEAEVARLQGNSIAALQHYEISAQAAAAAGFIHEQALAHELAAELSRTVGLVTAADQHARKASDCYRRWGAEGKVQHLTELFSVERGSQMQTLDKPSADRQRVVDMAVGMKVAQALSEEIVLDRLIASLMTNMIEHAGAEYGALILLHDNVPTVEAVGRVVNQEIAVAIGSAPVTADDIPISVMNSVLRTRKSVVFEDATTDAPSLQQGNASNRTIRSLLCLPLVKQGTLIGLLHLENNLASDVFSPERTAILEMLAPQAAISIETARLYSALLEENDLRSRTELSLRTARADLARAQHLTVLGGLAASIAHEINQPLSAIVSNAGAGLRWLKRPTPDIAEGLASLEVIKGDALRAASIVKALRSLAKQAPPGLTTVSVDEIIRSVLRLTAIEIEARAVGLTLDLDTNDAFVLADSVQIQQVVLNLVNNAVECMADDDTRTVRHLYVSSKRTKGTICVSVRDTGPGLDAAVAEHIFDPFFTTKDNGMGMGLAICRSILEAHGGSLNAQSHPDGGCVFTFDLSVVDA